MTGWEASNARASRWARPARLRIDLAFVNLDDQVMSSSAKATGPGDPVRPPYKAPSDGRSLCPVDHRAACQRGAPSRVAWRSHLASQQP
jgi:hypothetical protein